MAIYELKTDPDVFAAVLAGYKTHEIRFNDRGFAVGDTLLLRETKFTGDQIKRGFPLVYTGRTACRLVSHILTGYGLADGWCILSFAAHSSVPAQASTPDEADLRAEFERQHAERNLKRHGMRGTYIHAQIAAIWNQHKRTAEWCASRTIASTPANIEREAYYDDDGATRCSGCHANHDMNQEHGDDCWVARAETKGGSDV